LKCEVYWPQEMNAQQYGNISVSTLDESIEPSCTTRKFMVTQAKKVLEIFVGQYFRGLSLVGSKDVSSRECTQYHFTGWPDMGVPNDSATMLRFVKRIRSSLTNDKPIVVHC
ncbi:PREDICTED: tyrosine-protein phosphatase 10-like, partial [Amphimedon queenslandica]|uniref:Tyrosine-protein phosphatase domain-containing protein n=1 Tax=Amphimedon queenslandica TaxID=400682 RepID=A0AAN0IT88_AMPQE